MKTNRFRVITVASDLFMEKGVANTSMDDVVLASGVAKSNIYYHFKSKEDLIVSVLEHRIQELQSMVEEIINARMPVSQRIQQIYETFAQKIEERECVGGCPILSLMSVPIDEVKLRSQRFFEDLQATIEKLLMEGIQSGEFRKDVPVAQTSALLLSALEGAIMLVQTSGDVTALSRTGETIVHFLQAQ
ncbi:TetR/AcrR family transcriptional regulator [Priestia megaterium]|nr:TetR/AcrR family transcriptional regulator [Priestia megaterium]